MNPDLKELLARVEGATGADREIDRDLAEFAYPEILTRERRVIKNGEFAWLHPESGFVRCEPYTASLDAALALCGRVLPGSYVGMQQNRHRGVNPSLHAWSFWIEKFDGDRTAFQEGFGETPALALLAACLHALIDRGGVDISSVARGDVTPPNGATEAQRKSEGAP